jgi:hypothetical protein
MTFKSLFHVERKVFDSPRLHQSPVVNQIPAGWGLRQLGPQLAPAGRRKATFGQHGPWRHGSHRIIEVRDARGRKALRYVKDGDELSHMAGSPSSV